MIITGNFCAEDDGGASAGNGGGGGNVGSILSRFESAWNGENGKSSNRSIVEFALDDDESGDGKLAKKFFNSVSNSIKKRRRRNIQRLYYFNYQDFLSY